MIIAIQECYVPMLYMHTKVWSHLIFNFESGNVQKYNILI